MTRSPLRQTSNKVVLLTYLNVRGRPRGELMTYHLTRCKHLHVLRKYFFLTFFVTQPSTTFVLHLLGIKAFVNMMFFFLTIRIAFSNFEEDTL